MSKTAGIVKVGIAELKIVEGPCVLRTSGLGSCVAVVLIDSSQSIAAMAHIMLPNSRFAKSGENLPAKYADTAIELLVRVMLDKGSQLARLKAKIAGGAQMFQFNNAIRTMSIGDRNVTAVKEKLQSMGIPLAAEDTGGNNGRTVEFDPLTDFLHIRTVHKGEKKI
ncbi:chemotaxis protein CheD [Halobacillus sp. A1]|uniref:chemotaxis protein CheD n=1 Tax=Halobacillus sp. A1 TaxID=2880262 RepID=UPI0020A66622|nr:chemotaxis protein CheD [Halobacillus sp. A1]MCP3031217.1 chemotaxis protein CheD [Halobacillus sp. A1]